MKDNRKQNKKSSLPEIPRSDSSKSSQMIKKIEKASDINPEAVVSALRKWLTEDNQH